MALIKCPECGKEISDMANFCPNCGFPVSERTKSDSTKTTSKRVCPKCNSGNIQISIESHEVISKERNEVRKKSSATRLGNKLGRTAMIGMTGGLWALTPKKSDYSEVKKGKSKIKKEKYGVCQDCGYSWRIFF